MKEEEEEQQQQQREEELSCRWTHEAGDRVLFVADQSLQARLQLVKNKVAQRSGRGRVEEEEEED